MHARVDVDRLTLIRVVCTEVGITHLIFAFWVSRATYFRVGPQVAWAIIFGVAAFLCLSIAVHPSSDRRVVYAGGLTVLVYSSRATAIVVAWARGEVSLWTPQSAIAGTAWLLLAFFALVTFFLMTDYLSQSDRNGDP